MTKYIIVIRKNYRVEHLDIGEYKIERVDSFKYLGMDINKDANNHGKIKIRLAAANRCYIELVSLIKSKFL